MMKLFILLFFLTVYSFAMEIGTKIEKSQKLILELNKDLSCSVDADCVSVKFGYKACGGPDSYLIASKKNKKFKKLNDEIQNHRKLRIQESSEKHLLSTCDAVAEPYPRCLNKECKATTPKRIEQKIVHGLLGLEIDENTRIKSQREFEKIWKNWTDVHHETRPMPEVDFGQNELLAEMFCKKDGKKVFMYYLSQVENAGPLLLARYTKQKLCKVQMIRPCESRFASIPKIELPIDIKVFESPQACDGE